MTAPNTIRTALSFMFATVFVLIATSIWKFINGEIEQMQAFVNFVVYMLLFLFPYRVMHQSWSFAVVWVFLMATSVAPVFMGFLPETTADKVVLLGAVVPVQIFSIYFLFKKDSVAWLLKKQQKESA